MFQKITSIGRACKGKIATLPSQKSGPKILVLAFVFLSFTFVIGQNALVPFTFKLTTASKTSAGVFKSDGTLVRTLWSGVDYAAGNHKGTWDRRDDEGKLVDDTAFDIRVLSNNVKYTWEGVVGNSSDSFTGSTVIRMFRRFQDMAITGNTGYYAAGYGEGTTSAHRLDMRNPQSKTSIMQYNSTDHNTDFVATDGNYVYWAGYDPLTSGDVTFAYATTVNGDKEVKFSNGTSVSTQWGRTYNYAIDVVNGNRLAIPTGIAVQKNGNFLFIAHGGIDAIHVLNKTTGSLVNTITITNPRDICVDTLGKLWVISGSGSVQKFTVNNNGTLSSALLTLSGLTEPLAIEVSPNNKYILVADGGSSQQLKAYINTSGSPLWTYGLAGGYSSDPKVANNKFYFNDGVTDLSNTFIAFEKNGSFWVNDVGNERVQHFDSSRNFIDRIMQLPHTYNVDADRNDPTRVFNEFLEFKVDYSKPLAPNNGSWELVRNWRHSIKAEYFRGVNEIITVFRNVLTLKNGRTYAMVDYIDPDGILIPEIVELPKTGNLRYTGVRLEPFSLDIWENDGSLRRMITNREIGQGGYWETQALTGFNSTNDPVWGNATQIGTIPTIKAEDPAFNDLSFPAMTSSDVLVLFNPGKVNTGYHLGGIKKGTNKYLWKTAPSTTVDYQGPYPTDGSYDIGNGVEYAGGHVYTVDKNIFWNYHGEFWKSSQTNIWHHVNDDGLTVAQFGVTSVDGQAREYEAYAMGAGNVFSSTFVKVGNDYYLYHNDESVHAGLHRWKISGLNTISEQSIPVKFSTVTGGLTGSYFDGPDLNNTNFVTNIVNNTIELNSAPSKISNPASFSVRWEGFIKPAYSLNYTFYTNTSKGVRLWVDGNLIIDKWTNSALKENSSSPIALIAGKKYSIRMEINGGTASLLWSCSSLTKQIIPATAMYPAATCDYSNGINLMEGLRYKTVLEDGLYGWKRNSATEDNTNSEKFWHVRTSIKSHKKERPDLFLNFRMFTNKYSVTRDLGKVNTCLNSWKLNGTLNFEGNTPNFDDVNYGGFFDVLDDAGKIIARITHEVHYDGNKNPNQIKCNKQNILEMGSNDILPITNKPQPFEIMVNNSGVYFKYAGMDSIKVSLFDNTSNWKKPSTLKFHFVGTPTNEANNDRFLGVENLVFSTNTTSNPTVTVTGKTTICTGDSVKLTASAGNSFLWNNNATTQSIFVKQTGTYSVTSKDVNNCQAASLPVTITVTPKPVPVITTDKSATICQGDSVKLSISQTGTYLWNNSKTSKEITVKNAGSYSVILTDVNGCSGSSGVTSVAVNPLPAKPTITADGNPEFCMGHKIKLSSSVANSWLWNNNANTRDIEVDKAGDYTVKITDANGCSNTSAAFKVKVNPIPSPTVTVKGSLNFCKGDSVILISSPASSYLWSNQATTREITVMNTGNYNVTIKDANACSSVSDPVNVNTITVAVPVITRTGNTLSSSASSGNSWYLNGVEIPGAKQQVLEANENGLYSVKVNEGNCSEISEGLNFTKETVGVETINTNKIIVYPNPSNDGIFKLQSKQLTEGRIEIYSSSGLLIKTYLSMQEIIDLSAYANGIYFIRVSGTKDTYNFKVIKN